MTVSQLSAVLNGVATILLFAFIDPQISIMTDDVIDGQISEAMFRKTILLISASRLTGTFLTQFLLIPAAHIIAWVANLI